MIELAIICIFVIIVIYFIAYQGARDQENYLYGFWVAEDDEFCEDSGINSMLIFIGEPEYSLFSCTRKGYIIIEPDKTNQGFTMEYYPKWCALGQKYSNNATIKFDDNQIWPETLTCQVDISAGQLKIISENTLLANLLKQHDVTNIARDTADCELI